MQTHTRVIALSTLFATACGGEPLDAGVPPIETLEQAFATNFNPPIHAATLDTPGALVHAAPQLLYATLAEESTVTDYSGPSGGGDRALSRPAADNDAITGVTLGERSDDPCYLRAHYKDVETNAVGATRTFDECDGNEGDVAVVTLPTGAFVTGVRVCLNDDRDKLKGLELIGDYAGCMQGAEHVYLDPAECSRVFKAGGQEYRLCDTDQAGYVEVDCTPYGLSRYVERTNCDGTNRGPDSDWEEEVHCPSGQVATGMQLNVREGGGDRQMVNGIALVCDDLISVE